MQTTAPTTGWRQAWDTALYGPGGFFLREAPADHFRTSVAASRVYARAVRALAERVDAALGHPDPFDVVDVGAGRGELLLGLGDVPERWRLTAVERAPDPGCGLRWTSEIPSLTGLLVANEWLDDVPCDVLFDDRVVEVAADGTESLGGVADAGLLAWRDRWWPQGSRAEIGLTRDLAWQRAVSRVKRGVAVAVDYGHVLGDRSTWFDRRTTLTGWLRGRPVHPVPDGSCDITAHVALDALVAAAGGRLLAQRDALTALGVDATPPPRAMADTDPHGYLALLADATSAAELLDRRRFGAYGWVVVPVGVEDPLA